MSKIEWMKSRAGLLGAWMLAVGLLFLLAVFVGPERLVFLRGSADDFTPLLSAFRKDNRPLTEINFSALYGGNGQFQVLHPLLDLRHVRDSGEDFVCADPDHTQTFEDRLRKFGSPAREESPGGGDSQAQLESRKSAALTTFLNREGPLPEDFVINPPFVDEWGNSYAYLLSRSAAPYGSKEWVEEHLSYFKISELGKVLQKYQIHDVRYSVIAGLSDSEIENIIRADGIVITKDYVFFKNQSRLGFSPLGYWVYDIRDLRTYLRDGPYELSPYTPGAVCLWRLGDACWTYNSRHTMAYLYRYSVVILILLGLIVMTALGFYFHHLYGKDREQRKSRLALQVLSHEFRTPVSSMLLMIHQLSHHQSELSLKDQDLMTRISSEAFRLQRIIELSKNYLQAEGRGISFKSIEIPSINGWILDLISEMNADVRCAPLEKDLGLKTDPFWLKFVLSNLVQNAFLHGKPPVLIRLQNVAGQLKITVEDHGECEFGSLKQMTEAFVKSRQSPGMGLGLNIAKFILDEWGVEIQFSKAPTSFSLLFKSPEFA